MRRFGLPTIFLVVLVACYSIYLGVTSSVKDKVEEVKNQIPSVPKTKVGELYHKTAAKVDGLMGDRANQLKHEAVLAAKEANDAVGSGVLGTLKSWTGIGASNTDEAKAILKDAANQAAVKGQEAVDAAKDAYNQIPDSKTGEIYHKAAAKVDEMMGDESGKYKHQALLMAKGAKDSVEEAKTGVVDKIKEWTGLASDTQENLRQQASDAADSVKSKAQEHWEAAKQAASDAPVKAAGMAYEGAQAAKEFNADIPTTKLGEMYHKAAAKVDGMMGDEKSKARHEALLGAKEIKDGVNSAKENVQAKVSDAKDAAQEKAQGAFDKLKQWTGLASAKAQEAKQKVKQAAK